MGALGDIEQADQGETADPFRPERLAGVVNAVSDPITVQAPDGRVVFANHAAAMAAGAESPDELTTPSGEVLERFELFDELGRPVDPDDLPGRAALRTGVAQTLTIRYRDRTTGAQRWSSISSVPLLDDDGRPEFAVNIIHDVTASKEIEEALRISEARSRLLADATRDLDESLDLDRTIGTAMALAVPHMADWATLDLVQPDGSVERVAVDVADPSRAEIADRLWAFAVEPGAGRAGDRAIDERRPIIANISPERLVDDPARPGLIATLRELKTTSAMAVPLMARGSVEGVLFLAASDDSRRYEEADAAYAVELGRRIALAVGNARLYAAEQAARRSAEDAATRAETLLADLEAQSNRFETTIRNLPSGVIVAEAPSGRTMIVNEAVDRILGTAGAPADLIWDRVLEGFRPDGTPYGPYDWPLARTIRTGESVDEEEIRIARPDGSEAWIAARSVPIVGAGGTVAAGVVVFEDVTARRTQQVRTEFLAEASAILASSLEYEDTIASVARLAVPAVADWSAVDLVGENGRLQTLALAHSDPARAAGAAELRARLEHGGIESISQQVMRTVQPIAIGLSRTVIEGAIETIPAAALTDGAADALRSLGGSTLVCVPLVAGGQPIGTLTLASSATSSNLREEDLPFAQEVAARVAAAIQNARLFRDAARFRTILDTVRDGVTVGDPETFRVGYANDAVLEQLGRTRDQVVGHMTPDWTEGLSSEQLRAFVAPLLSGEEISRSLDVVRLRPDGTRVPVEIRWQQVELPGVGPQLVASSRNIRDRIETEQRLTQLARAEHARAAELNAIIGAIGEGLIVLDSAGRVTLANPRARALLEPLEDWTLDAVLARIEDPDGAARDALTSPGTSVTLRLRGPAQRWIEISNNAVGDEPLPDNEHIVILRDVTVAREREAVRDAFVGILSHELRTPVTTIYAGAKLLSRGEGRIDEAARRDIFDDIHAEAERLHRLVEDVVALTRFGEGTLDIGSEPVLLQRVVPIVVGSEQSRWPQGRFEVDLEPGLPPVSGDPTYVEQVIRNLLANAVKYGGSQAAIRLVVRAEEQEVRVHVIDNGPGFPEGEATRLFELYYRSPSTSRSASGSGIGLFVCARLLNAMGGRIWAANRPEGGAEFGFALRVMTEEA
jgi:PAS domain S-box-containing protein